MSNIYKKIKINWIYPIQPTSLQVGTVKIYRGTSEFTLDNLLSQTELVTKAYDPSFTEFIDDFELKEDTIYYYMIIVYGDVAPDILAATNLYSIKIETSQDTIPSNEFLFTTTTGTIDYSGVVGDQIVLNDGNTITLKTNGMYGIVVPSGTHKVVLVETRSSGYVGLGGEALVEIINFPILSSVNTFDTCADNPSPNLVKVPTTLPPNITHIQYMFDGATSFNQDISMWDVSNVVSMEFMFGGATSFNQDISNWDVSKVTNMWLMFFNATSFNSDLSSWDVSSVTNIDSMFFGATSFSSDISSWDVSKVTDMHGMFVNATSFNSDISSWDVGNVIDMSAMFENASSFNQDISSWDVSSVNSMNGMFQNATAFNQDLNQWCVLKITSKPIYFNDGAPLFTADKHPVWGTCPNG